MSTINTVNIKFDPKTGKAVSVHFRTVKPQKVYRIGDTRVKGKTTYIKQYIITREGYRSSRGKLSTEWVVKDGPRDRESPNYVKRDERYS